jgi:hypothetical protein
MKYAILLITTQWFNQSVFLSLPLSQAAVFPALCNQWFSITVQASIAAFQTVPPDINAFSAAAHGTLALCFSKRTDRVIRAKPAQEPAVDAL